MLSLIAKDFKLLFQGSSKNKMSRVLSLLFTLIAGAIFIVIEVYLFNEIFKNLKKINQATDAYFSLFLFIISSLLTVFAIFTAKKLFFNEEDNAKLQALPVEESKIIFSKLFFLFITMYFMNLVFNMPLFITYGLIYKKMIIFYFTALFYPVLLFFFQAGIALLLVYPFKLLLDYFKKHIIIQFVSVVVVAFGLTYLYSRALNIFVSLVASNNIDSLFTTKSINTITSLAKYMVPINFLEDAFVNKNSGAVFPSILISFGVFIIGLSVAIYFYNRFLQNVFYNKKKKEGEERKLKTESISKALIKKEFVLLFRNSNFLFSFTGLLMVEPFLAYLIIEALNTIFTSGTLAYYLIAVPNIISFLDVMLMMLVSAIIFLGANNYITNENKNVRLMKSIPVSYSKQLTIKVSIPLILSTSFLLVSYFVLAITKTIPWITFGYGLLMNIIFITTLAIVSLFEELNIKRNQQKNALLSSMYTYLVPLVYFGVAIVLCYFKVNYNIIFGIGIGVVLLSLLPYLIKFKTRISEKFLSLEVSN